MKLTPDNFEPITEFELRELWKRYRDADVRRLVLEVHRARAVLGESHADALRAQYALWQKHDGNVRRHYRRSSTGCLPRRFGWAQSEECRQRRDAAERNHFPPRLLSINPGK
jgi:hypothetical protein